MKLTPRTRVLLERHFEPLRGLETDYPARFLQFLLDGDDTALLDDIARPFASRQAIRDALNMRAYLRSGSGTAHLAQLLREGLRPPPCRESSGRCRDTQRRPEGS